MIVNVHEKGIDVLCFSRKTFLLGNHFPCEKNRDAIYYILYAWKQLKLDRFADSLFVTGTPPLNEELVQNLRLYIRHVYQGRFPKKKRFENINAGNIPFELAAFSLCES